MTMYRFVLAGAVSVVLCLVPAGVAGAQRADTAAALRTVLQSARDPSLRSALRVPLPVLNFTATTTEKQVKGQAGFNLSPRLLGNVTVTAPVDADRNGRTSIADRGGLARTAHVSGGLFFYRWRPRSDTTRINQICERQRVEFTAAGKAAVAAQPNFCSTVGPLPDSAKGQIRRAVRWGVPLSFAGNAGWGREAFEWTDPATLQEHDDEHTNWNVQLAAGSFVPKIGFLLVEYTHQRLFKASGQTELCAPVGTAGALACNQRSTSAPTERSDHLITGELRHFFGRDLAAGVAVTRNLDEAVTSYEVPFYFIPDPESGRLNGGIAARWSTDERRLQMSVFIGTVFRPQIPGLVGN